MKAKKSSGNRRCGHLGEQNLQRIARESETIGGL